MHTPQVELVPGERRSQRGSMERAGAKGLDLSNALNAVIHVQLKSVVHTYRFSHSLQHGKRRIIMSGSYGRHGMNMAYCATCTPGKQYGKQKH